jgi:hypothetical protein
VDAIDDFNFTLVNSPQLAAEYVAGACSGINTIYSGKDNDFRGLP